MLVDVELDVKPKMKVVLSIISNGPSEATRLDVGLYQVRHFSFEHTTKTELDADWLRAYYSELIIPSEYGVCDSPKQFMKVFGDKLRLSGLKFCISFTQIAKKDQPVQGGWRWHKWGPYLGDQKQTTEYLRDEPQIEEVFVYHVYEVLS